MQTKYPNGEAQTKSLKTRRKILKTARKLFRTRGFEKTTMRDIAHESGIALGAAYYYFNSKNDLVLEFYLKTQKDIESRSLAIFAETRDFRKRLKLLFDLQFQRLAPDRKFLHVLAREASSPKSPLSPFSGRTKSIRDVNLAVFKSLIRDCTPEISGELAEMLPSLLWLIQMALIFFWLHDSSRNQQRSRGLADSCTEIVVQAVRLYRLPLARHLFKSLNRMLGEVMSGL